MGGGRKAEFYCVSCVRVLCALPAAVEYCGQQGSLTGVKLEEQLDGVVVQVAAVQDHLDERRQAALTRRRHRHRAGHVQGAEHWNTHTHTH